MIFYIFFFKENSDILGTSINLTSDFKNSCSKILFKNYQNYIII